MTDTAVLEDSVEIAAAPERVGAPVTDLPRMASWSPQVARTLGPPAFAFGVVENGGGRSRWNRPPRAPG